MFKPQRCLFLGMIAACLASGHPAAWSCDTPVYRYAMYRWEPAPYECYYFHKGPIAEAAAKLHRLIDEASTSQTQPANVMLAKIDLEKDPELKGVPRDVGKLWTAQEKPRLPGYLLVTPHGAKLFSGTLDEAQLRALTDSPARRQLVKQLAEGKAMVLVLLDGKEASANVAAEKLVQDVQQDIAAGKIEVYSGPPAMGDEGAARKKPSPPAIGFVKVARDDAAERWLVEPLLALDAELQKEELRSQPLLFAVFGRGRALPPFVGKEINRDNLLAAVDFVTGACSCTVKDQNPGVDLLIAHDWPTTAANLAEKFGAEEGNEGQVNPEAVFPRLVVPGDDADPKPSVAMAAEKPTSEPAATDAKGAGPQADKPAATDGKNSGDKPAAKSEDKPTDEPVPEDETAVGSPVVVRPPVPTPLGSVFVVGIGTAIALVILFALTFFVLRPR